MKSVNKIYQLIMGVLLLFSCEEPYAPTYEPGDTAPILIIEGYIDMSGNSRFKLSQTVPLSSEETIAPVGGADLAIESEDNQTYAVLSSAGAGEYSIAHPALNMNTRYRLRIKNRGKEYLSDWVTPYATSEISGIDKQRTDTGMDIFVSTVNGNDNSRYYRWEFEETWKFSSRFMSFYIFDNGVRPRRFPQENISTCFNQEISSDVLIGTTENLSDNTVSRQKIQSIPNLSEKLMYRYSILVKQFSISKEAYVFWSIMKKNSESVGDIFGSMPSELKGNVTNTADPREPVIAMIEASLPTQKRIYYNAYELSEPWAVFIPFYYGCESFEVLVGEAAALFRNTAAYIPTNELYMNPASPAPTHYSYTTRRCTDCSMIGSLNVPDFWTDFD